MASVLPSNSQSLTPPTHMPCASNPCMGSLPLLHLVMECSRRKEPMRLAKDKGATEPQSSNTFQRPHSSSDGPSLKHKSTVPGGVHDQVGMGRSPAR